LGQPCPHEAGQPSLASCVGAYAHRVVRQPGFTARVLSCVGETVYFIGGRGQLAWIGLPEHAPHRRAILARHDASAVRRGAILRAAGGLIIVEGMPPIRTAQAQPWSPDPFDRSRLLSWDRLRARVDACMLWLARLPGWRGLGLGIGPMLGIAHALPLDTADRQEHARWSGAARRATEDVLGASRSGAVDDILEAGLGLVGLGPGLTPAGDDFMGGLLFAVHQLHRAHPGRVAWSRARRNTFLENARQATNLISYTILSDLAHGHAPAAMSELMWAILHGVGQLRTTSAAEKLTCLGSTSGWDMLAGVTTGLSLVTARDAR
jgi:hypothetical protein